MQVDEHLGSLSAVNAGGGVEAAIVTAGNDSHAVHDADSGLVLNLVNIGQSGGRLSSRSADSQNADEHDKSQNETQGLTYNSVQYRFFSFLSISSGARRYYHYITYKTFIRHQLPTL